ncbi:MAG TPA: hypothetical protein VFO95_07440 [Gemmatimonadales bacterium]|jgi:hypothetical protein|nr:hypothetical protein [Gemmatimonadales bacterium]
MSKLVMVVALFGMAACAPREEQPPAADTTLPAPVTPADTAATVDTMIRDTTRDTTGTH